MSKEDLGKLIDSKKVYVEIVRQIVEGEVKNDEDVE